MISAIIEGVTGIHRLHASPVRSAACRAIDRLHRAIRLLAPGILCCAAALTSACASTQPITILHLNDLHARFLPDANGLGGFAYVASAIERERAATPNTLVLHGGDMVQGTPVSTLFEGVPAFEVGNRLGIDVHCLGNHEFDYGWEKIREFTTVSTAPIVSANVVNDTGEHLLEPYVVRRVGSVDIAVIGALTERLPALLKPGLTGPWRAAAIVETLRPIVAEADAKADLVIVLGHLFDDEDEQILRELPDVDILIGGHNHGGRETPLVIDERIGVKLRAYGRELGRLDLKFDPAAKRVASYAWKRIPIHTSDFKPDPETALVVEDWESRVSEIVDVPIGECRETLRKPGLKRAIEKAMLEKTGADLAYMNPGGIRDSMPAGPMLARSIWNILPFDNEIVEALVKGSEAPEEVAEGLAPNKLYHLVTNDFVAGRWADRKLDFKPTGETLRDLFLDWVKERRVLP